MKALNKDMVKRIYVDILHGNLRGLSKDLAKYLKEDRLSPGLRELLAEAACKVLSEELKKYKSLEETVKKVAEFIDHEWFKFLKSVEPLVNSLKPYYIPPLLIELRGLKLLLTNNILFPEEIGCWIVQRGKYVFVTFWFKFPYDLYPGDGEEYEPWTAILEDNKVIEYQARSHWRLVHINPKIVLHLDGRPVIAFADFAHTPVPVLDLNALSKIFNASPDKILQNINKYCTRLIGFTGEDKPILIEKIAGREMGDLLPLRTYIEGIANAQLKYYIAGNIPLVSNYSVLVHVGPSRCNPPPHNPLKGKWYDRPIFVGTKSEKTSIISRYKPLSPK